MAQANLVTNPSFREDTDGWQAINGATIASVSGDSFYGSEYLRVVKSNVAASGVHTSNYVPVTGNLPYAISAYVRVPATIPVAEAASVSVRVTWLTGTSVSIRDDSTPVARLVGSQGWVRLSGIFTAPANAVLADITVLQLVAGTSGEVFHLDAVLFEQSSFVGGYRDNIPSETQTSLVNRALTPPQLSGIGTTPLRADVTINDLVLNTIDENNTIWVCTDIEGWWGHSNPEIPDIIRGTLDGSYNISGRYATRLITLKGVFLPPDEAHLVEARDRLIAATNLVRKGGWLRTNENPTRAAFVRLSGRPQMQTINARGRTEFSIGLQAVDPIRYHWNDSDLEGLTTVALGGNTIGQVNNIGTADVTATFRITGPVGAGTVVNNYTTGETLKLTSRLRGDSPITNVTFAELYDNVASLEVSQASELIPGDLIEVYGVGSAFDSYDTPYRVVAALNTFPYTVSYERVWPNQARVKASGNISLAARDVLEIDTYERSVTLNGNGIGFRSRVDTLVDWIKLAPGANTIELVDNIEKIDVSVKGYEPGKAALATTKAHFFVPGDSILVSLPETAVISRKGLSGNVVTLTTDDTHGFVVGDVINVISTERSAISAKSRTSNVATLTTAAAGNFGVNDVIQVALPTETAVISKSVISNVATLTTAADHQFVVGDAISVDLPSTASVVSKSAQGNLVTLGTSGPNSFAIGDTISVALATSASVIAKSKTGSAVVLTTSSDHRFSSGDSVTVALPTSATPTQAILAPSAQAVTVTTSSTHNFSVGDRINVNLNVPTSTSVTNKARTTTTCTLTLSSSATDRFLVGETINVSIGDATFDGVGVVSAISGSTITYTRTNTGTVSTTSASGTVVNLSLSQGFNGSKIVESVTSNTLTYLYYGNPGTSTSTVTRSSTALGTTPTMTNTTNQGLNGTFNVTSAGTTQFSYTVGN